MINFDVIDGNEVSYIQAPRGLGNDSDES